MAISTTPLLPLMGEANDLLEKIAQQYTPAQQLWLSGYLYALAAPCLAGPTTTPAPPTVRNEPSGSEQPPLKVTVLYGSQTGNSKKVANQTAERLRQTGWTVTVTDMNDYVPKNLKQEQYVIFVVSTHGEGEPPTAAEDLHKWLHSARAGRLERMQYAVCGLGDRSYLHFCKTAQDFDRQLESLGATRLVAHAACDVAYEPTARVWMDALVGALANVPQPVTAGPSATYHHTENDVPPISQFDRNQPYEATILEKIQLNGRGATKETWHIELSADSTTLPYEVGDALGVIPLNSPSLVREILYAAMLNGQKVVSYNGKERLFQEILQQEVEITVLTHDLVSQYAQWGNLPKLQAIVNDSAAFKQFAWGRNVADLLRAYPVALSEETLLTFLRPLPARLYSIASSPLAHPDEVHLTVAAVRYEFLGYPHLGAASTYLADQVSIGDTIRVFVQPNAYFKLPANDATDIIMVGAGTGVAPFRGFVSERAERGATGKNWLFFGNPHFETDFLYHTEWLQHLKKGTLDRLDIAFSRDQAEKLYVQHRLIERSRLLFERLENGAHIYICGDKNRMAHDVQDALRQIVAKESGKGAEYAEAYIKTLKKQRRLLEDVY